MIEMNWQYEVLDTVITGSYPLACLQSFTNTEGIIFLMDPSGRVYSFDPFGTRQMIRIRDPQQD